MKKLSLILLLLIASTFAKAQEERFVEPFGGFYVGRAFVTGDFYDMDLSSSYEICLDLLKMGFPVGGNPNVRFRLGARWDFFTLGDKCYKMKFHYAGLPLGLTFRKRLFKVGVQCTPEYKVYSRTKDKTYGTTIVEHLEGANPFRLSGEVSFSFAVIGLYCRYSATPLFKSGYHPGSDARLLTFGFMLDL